MDLRTITWKEGDSRTEMSRAAAKFSEHFVAIDDISMLREEHHLFIWGTRGMGKTALAWHHEHTNGSALVLKIDFEEAEDWVNAIVEKLNYFHKVQGFPALKFLENAWYEAILTELMRRLQQCGRILLKKDTITRYLRMKTKERSVLHAIFDGLQDVEGLLNKHSGVAADPVTNTLKVTAKGLLLLEDFFQQRAGFRDAEKALCENLRPIPRRSISVIVDSVDKFLMPVSFPEAGDEHRTLCLVVRALCRALLHLHQEHRFSSVFDIKVFLPLDMKNSMKDRAYEHELIYHHNIRWTADELALFIAKQLDGEKANLRDPDQLIRNTWDILFPFQVENAVTKVKHRSLDYLLRHTQYRPRQLLFCCRAMTEHAKKVNRPTLTTREFTEVIHEYCRESSGRILDEYKAPYPNIFDIIRKIENAPNILSSDILYQALSSAHLPTNIDDTHDLVQLLFDIGFLGVVTDEDHIREMGLSAPYTTVNTRQYYFVFAFSHPRFSVANERQFAIHPAFYSRFNFTIDSNITVSQFANFRKIYPQQGTS